MIYKGGLDSDKTRYYRCMLCGSLFFSPGEADRCCKRAKVQVLCTRLRQNYAQEIDQQCNAVRAKILAKGGLGSKV